MAKVLNFLRVLRNNWKKSTFGAVAFSYGVSYSKDAYERDQLMRKYCAEIVKLGDAPLPTQIKPRHVTVILNPAAKKNNAKKLFQKYSEPLLHLAGIAVTIIQTEAGAGARNIVMNLDTPTDAIIVAGGDGTLSDVLTGLVRKYQGNLASVKQCPIGILPLGKTNRVAHNLYHKYEDFQEVKEIIEATMAVINDKCKTVDILQVEPLEKNSETELKPVFAMGTVEWGAWRDARASTEKYWWWGPLRKYVTYIFNGYKRNLSWDCKATIKYTNPCHGCSNCYRKEVLFEPNVNRRWWHAFLPQFGTLSQGSNIDYSKVVNKNCGTTYDVCISTTELHIETANVHKQRDLTLPSSLEIQIGPKHVDYASFVKEGWRQENEEKSLRNQTIAARTVELIPEDNMNDRTIYIDNEEYELKPISIKLLSNAVKIFSSESGS